MVIITMLKKLLNLIYSVELKNYSKKGKFAIDILDGGSVLASGQQFEIEKKGMSQNDMFDF